MGNELVYPAFEIADKTEDFTIMLFQHDGFSVFFRPEKERWRERIKEVVDNNAKKLGIPTLLEWNKAEKAGANDKVLKQILEVYQ